MKIFYVQFNFVDFSIVSMHFVIDRKCKDSACGA
jgi:hypothetical protein